MRTAEEWGVAAASSQWRPRKQHQGREETRKRKADFLRSETTRTRLPIARCLSVVVGRVRGGKQP